MKYQGFRPTYQRRPSRNIVMIRLGILVRSHTMSSLKSGYQEPERGELS